MCHFMLPAIGLTFCYGDQYASDMLLLLALQVVAIIVGCFSVVITAPLSRNSRSENAIVTAAISHGMKKILSDPVLPNSLYKP